jgi:GT2 family glycosyltransferase
MPAPGSGTGTYMTPDPAEPMPEVARDVTTVVVSRNRWADLSWSLPRHDGAVILIDNGSEDGTVERVREHFPHVQVVALPANRGAVARNLGVLLARTPYVAFADDDSWWSPGALATAAGYFRRYPRLAVLAGNMLVGDDGHQDPVCALMRDSPLPPDDTLPGPAVLGFVACGAVVRRSAFLEAGGFDDVVFFRGEEERLALDLSTKGWGLAYVDDVCAHHHPSTNRDPREGDARARRNTVLTAVLRRPWPVVAAHTASALRSGPSGRSGVMQAVARLPRALLHRRVVPPHVEAARRLLDHAPVEEAHVG